MKNLELELGLQSYCLGGKVEVCFNPTDANFLQRLLAVFASLEQRQAQRSQSANQPGSWQQQLRQLQALDAAMRQELDALFGAPVCEALFGDMSLYAYGGGLPLWMQLLLCVMEEMAEQLRRLRPEQANDQLEKYLAKYRRPC